MKSQKEYTTKSKSFPIFALIVLVMISNPIFVAQVNYEASSIATKSITISKIAITDYTNTINTHHEYSIISDIVNATTNWIARYGYVGVFSAALAENLFPPIPSELIFPLAGFTAHTKNLGLIEGVVGMSLMGAAGSTIGAIIIYYISRRFGRPAILRLGKHIGIGENELEKTEEWFEKYGRAAVFFGRMIPGVRELVSIPAGIEKMKFSVFVVFSFSGSLIWCSFLTWIGFYLGEVWNRFYDKYSFIFDILAILIVAGIILGIVFRHHKNRKKETRKKDQ